MTLAANRAAALEFVNAVRAKYNFDPIPDLPAGRRKQATSCPVARGIKDGTTLCDVSVPGRFAYVYADIGSAGRAYEAPPAAFSFVQDFDNGAYPDLIGGGV